MPANPPRVGLQRRYAAHPGPETTVRPADLLAVRHALHHPAPLATAECGSKGVAAITRVTKMAAFSIVEVEAPSTSILVAR